MVTAVVLINVERSKLQKVIDDVMAINGIAEVYSVAGEYDIVAIVRVSENSELAHIVHDIMPTQIEGITHTKTLIALNSKTKIDFKKLLN